MARSYEHAGSNPEQRPELLQLALTVMQYELFLDTHNSTLNKFVLMIEPCLAVFTLETSRL
jgi:hypothetical protein